MARGSKDWSQNSLLHGAEEMKRVVKHVKGSPMTKRKGWRGESWRHALAAKGVKTKGIGRVTQDVEGGGYKVVRIPIKKEKKKGGGIRDVAYVPDKA